MPCLWRGDINNRKNIWGKIIISYLGREKKKKKFRKNGIEKVKKKEGENGGRNN